MARCIRPFDDSLQKDRRRGSTNQSTNMSAVDPYRQGVELTNPTHFANGIAKIHDGYNDQTGQHGVPDLVLGQLRPILRDDNSYLEMAKFVPSTRFDSMNLTLSEINAILLEDVGSRDGTIEPLEIRDVVTRRTHPKDVSHRVCGALDEGNVNDRTSSEVFIYKANRDDLHIGSFPFVDESDVIGELPIASESISPDNRRSGAFHDDQENFGIIVNTQTMESDMLSVVRSMRPPSENCLSPRQIQVGANGFY